MFVKKEWKTGDFLLFAIYTSCSCFVVLLVYTITVVGCLIVATIMKNWKVKKYSS